MVTIISASALLGSIVYLLVAIEYTVILKKSGFLLLPAFVFSALWSLPTSSLSTSYLFTFDLVYVSIWSACILSIFQSNQQLTAFSVRWAALWSIPLLSLLAAIYTLFNTNQLHLYLYLFLCIGMLLLSEQLIRSSSGLIKATGIGVGSFFLYNLYFYSDTLIAGEISIELLQARSLASTTVGLMLLSAPFVFSRREYQGKKLAISRPLAFTTTSLVIAGSILLFVSTLGYLSRIGGDEYAQIEPFLLFLGVLFIGFNLGTSVRRARTRVWINKNFFKTKFDYNNEWQNLSDRLTLTSTEDNYAAIALQAILPIYNGTGGACYIIDCERFIPVHQLNIGQELPAITIAEAKPFLDKMEKYNWIFLPAATNADLAQPNDTIPSSIAEIDSIFLILPLASNKFLKGFMIISADVQQAENFDWEDLDLMRMVGKQLSNFVAYQMVTDELVVTRQFEAFNQFTTFVMHDLKNLIAQQAMVVENAVRFIDNPEFVKDAFSTIDNSVKRMNRLVMKIRQNTSLDLDKLEKQKSSLLDALVRALLQCHGKSPEPTLHTQEQDIFVNADPDLLTMAFTHLINNAIEACNNTGKVDIHTKLLPGEVEVKISDTGVGMNQEFIDNRLFKPFDTTKKSQGMGIGAYQYKKIISNIGGRVSVASKIGEGSCFTITLPLGQESSTSHQ